MTPERIEKQTQKRRNRKLFNILMKDAKGEKRRKALAELGKTVIEIETKNEDGTVTKRLDFAPEPKQFIPNINGLAHIAGKTYRKASAPRKTRLRFKVEQTAALAEDASRTLAKEIDKALAPVEVAA